EACRLAQLRRDKGVVRQDCSVRRGLTHAAERAEGGNLGKPGVEENQIESTPPQMHEPLMKPVGLGHVYPPPSPKRENFQDKLAIELVVLDQKDFRCGDH